MQEFQGDAGSSPEEVAEALVKKAREDGEPSFYYHDGVAMLAKSDSNVADILGRFYRERRIHDEYRASRQCA